MVAATIFRTRRGVVKRMKWKRPVRILPESSEELTREAYWQASLAGTGRADHQEVVTTSGGNGKCLLG
jgi:hypothetical protein